jgi:hypothetical protein
MIKLRLKDLQDIKTSHFLYGKIPGEYIYKGSLNYGIPGERTHSFDGEGGKDIHVHIDHEVFVLLQGRAVMEIDNNTYNLETGDICIIEPGENHHLNIDKKDPAVYFWFHAGDKPHWKKEKT